MLILILYSDSAERYHLEWRVLIVLVLTLPILNMLDTLFQDEMRL